MDMRQEPIFGNKRESSCKHKEVPRTEMMTVDLSFTEINKGIIKCVREHRDINEYIAERNQVIRDFYKRLNNRKQAR